MAESNQGQVSSGGKRIARNSLFLYGRMIFAMVVSLFTTRIVLRVLGVDDYGVAGVVGGIVGMLSVVTASLQISSSRFFTFALGTGIMEEIKKVFNTSMIVFIVMGMLVIVLGETVGLWFFYNKINIPEGSENAALWIYQFSIFSFAIGLTATPYGAVMTAHEKFDILTYFGIIDLLFRLGIVYLLLIVPGDEPGARLKFYATLGFIASMVSTIIYRAYCIYNFTEARFSWKFDKKLFKEIFSYSGWNVFGQTAGIMKNQGVNLIINIFFGPALNAARSLAYALNSAAAQLAGGFVGAVTPQITKSYGAGDTSRSVRLVQYTTKVSFYLFLIGCLPIFMEPEFFLKIWLGEVPDFVVVFVRLIIIESLIGTFSGPLMNLAQASGKIKWYQSIVGTFVMLNLPFAYLACRLYGGSEENGNMHPEVVFYVFIIMGVLSLFLRMAILKRTIGFDNRYFTNKILIPCVFVGFLSFVVPTILKLTIENNILRLILVSVSSVSFTGLFIYFIGLSKEEKEMLNGMIKDRLGRRKAILKQQSEKVLKQETDGMIEPFE